MAELNDRRPLYPQIVQQLLTEYAQHKPAFGDFEVLTIFDTQRHHYTNRPSRLAPSALSASLLHPFGHSQPESLDF